MELLYALYMFFKMKNHAVKGCKISLNVKETMIFYDDNVTVEPEYK